MEDARTGARRTPGGADRLRPWRRRPGDCRLRRDRPRPREWRQPREVHSTRRRARRRAAACAQPVGVVAEVATAPYQALLDDCFRRADMSQAVLREASLLSTDFSDARL